MTPTDTFGVVVIGRNEGERLKRCLASLSQVKHIVYVDSGSTDGSSDYVRGIGIHAVDLEPDQPFTAARARNRGIRHLLNEQPDLQFIQTVDGDCVIDAGWLENAIAALKADNAAAAVFGRLRERYPERSIYNHICDAEWNVPIGHAESCGGNAMHRVSAIEQAGFFNEALIAGEEPDLCLRLKQSGWTIQRIDAEMGEHDAAILRFGQWWQRSVRAGHAYAEHLWRHRKASLAGWKKQVARICVWGMAIPLAALMLVGLFGAWAMLMLLAYPAQFSRLWWRQRQGGSNSAKTAALAVIGKFAEAQGVLTFLFRLGKGSAPKLIEYKGS
jgi:GT2 family glycosyltransferase